MPETLYFDLSLLLTAFNNFAFSFVTELVCSCSKCVSKESFSSGISHTLATLKYSIPFFFLF